MHRVVCIASAVRSTETKLRGCSVLPVIVTASLTGSLVLPHWVWGISRYDPGRFARHGLRQCLQYPIVVRKSHFELYDTAHERTAGMSSREVEVGNPVELSVIHTKERIVGSRRRPGGRIGEERRPTTLSTSTGTQSCSGASRTTLRSSVQLPHPVPQHQATKRSS